MGGEKNPPQKPSGDRPRREGPKAANRQSPPGRSIQSRGSASRCDLGGRGRDAPSPVTVQRPQSRRGPSPLLGLKGPQRLRPPRPAPPAHPRGVLLQWGRPQRSVGTARLLGSRVAGCLPAVWPATAATGSLPSRPQTGSASRAESGASFTRKCGSVTSAEAADVTEASRRGAWGGFFSFAASPRPSPPRPPQGNARAPPSGSERSVRLFEVDEGRKITI